MMLEQQQPQEHPIRNEEDVPTEPATSPRQVQPQARDWPVQLAPVQVESMVLNPALC